MDAIVGIPALFLILFVATVSASSNQLSVPSNLRCACSGDVLTFECTLVGGSHTIWTGTAFDCGNSNNEIVLSNRNDGVMKTCSNGAIVGRITAVDLDCFTSQLNVTAASRFNDRTVTCVRSSDSREEIGASSITIVSDANSYPPPSDVSLAGISGGSVTFNWTSACSSVEYIITSDCGVCPPSTNTVSAVTCTGFQLPTDSRATTCFFSVNSRVCQVTSDLSTAVSLRVPDAPTVRIIPTYSNTSQMLTRVEFTPEIQSEVISGDISGPILNYFSAFLSSDGLFNSTRLSARSSEHSFDYTVPPGLCSPSATVSINISAANRVGRGFPSDTETIGCVNDFVGVYFYSNNSTITCTFKDEIDTQKSCRIQYGLYDEEQTYSIQGTSTTDYPNRVSLNLTKLVVGRYRYVIVANSNVTTVRIEGNFMKDPPKGLNIVVVAVTIVVTVGAVLLLTTTAVIVSLCIFKSRKHRGDYGLEINLRETVKYKDPRNLLKLKEITGRYLKVYEVDRDCALGDYKSEQWGYLRGRAFYELTDRKEDIHEGQEIILLKKSTEEKLFSPQVDSSVLQSEGLLGEGVSRPKYSDEYRVFVQCMGSGKRHIQAHTYVIYEEPEHNKDLEQGGLPVEKSSINLDLHGDKKQPLTLPVPKDYFVTEQVETKGMTLTKFWKTHRLKKKKLNVFLEVDQMVQKPIKVRDVLLMDKDTGGKLFIDPVALSEVKDGKQQEIDSKWRVLVAGEYKQEMYSKVILEPGTWVAYENPKFVYGSKFRALVVQDNNVRMSDFLSREIGVFERGKAFYELKKGEEEDLLYCRKTVNVADGVIPQLLEKSDSSAPSIKWIPEATIAAFYSIDPNVPGEGISPPTSKENTFFIHDTSQGARCLKKGTVVLYNCGMDDSKKDGGHVDSDQEDDDRREDSMFTVTTRVTPLT